MAEVRYKLRLPILWSTMSKREMPLVECRAPYWEFYPKDVHLDIYVCMIL